MFIHSPDDGLSSCFQFVMIANKAAVSLCVQGLLSFLSGKYRGWEKLAPMVGPRLTFKEMVKLPF